MDPVVDQDAAFRKPVPERLELVGGPKREVKVGEEEGRIRCRAHKIDERPDLQRRADVEVGLVVAPEELERRPPRPALQIEEAGHARYLFRAEATRKPA